MQWVNWEKHLHKTSLIHCCLRLGNICPSFLVFWLWSLKCPWTGGSKSFLPSFFFSSANYTFILVSRWQLQKTWVSNPGLLADRGNLLETLSQHQLLWAQLTLIGNTKTNKLNLKQTVNKKVSTIPVLSSLIQESDINFLSLRWLIIWLPRQQHCINSKEGKHQTYLKEGATVRLMTNRRK